MEIWWMADEEVREMRVPLIYPRVYQTLAEVYSDTGTCEVPPEFQVPARWDTRLPGIEALLTGLTFEEVECLAVGEASEREALIKKQPELDVIAELLDEFFTDWE
jgi:hypothetical protein